jgi:hypothetical protein
MLGTLTQFDDLATGCADGVGEVPWCHVEVPYTPIGRLHKKKKKDANQNSCTHEGGERRETHSSSASQFSYVPAS